MIQPTIIPTFHANGYNAGIHDSQGRRLLTYRYHPNPKQWRTKLMMQERIASLIHERPITLPGMYADMSHEDGRMFTFQNKLYLSLTLSAFNNDVNQIVPCSMAYGELVETLTHWEVTNIKIPKFGLNNFQGQEKNFVFFECEKRFYFIYQGSPEQVVCRLAEDGETVDEVLRTPSPSWSHGEIRGGTQPLSRQPNNGQWLRFFHSLYKGKTRGESAYCIGALLMDAKPPFTITQISKWPVFSGDERYVPGWNYWKPNVAIVYGAIANENGWLLSLGMNDSFCATLNVKEKDLNL